LTQWVKILGGVAVLVAGGGAAYFALPPSQSTLACDNPFLLSQVETHISNNLGVYGPALEGTGFLEKAANGLDLINRIYAIDKIYSQNADASAEFFYGSTAISLNLSTPDDGLVKYCQSHEANCSDLLDGQSYSSKAIEQGQEFAQRISAAYQGVTPSSITTLQIDRDTKYISCKVFFTLHFAGAPSAGPQEMEYQAQRDEEGNWSTAVQFAG
jgi:hypothetical protein